MRIEIILFIVLMLSLVLTAYLSWDDNITYVKFCKSINGEVLGKPGEFVCVKSPIIILDKQ